MAQRPCLLASGSGCVPCPALPTGAGRRPEGLPNNLGFAKSKSIIPFLEQVSLGLGNWSAELLPAVWVSQTSSGLHSCPLDIPAVSHPNQHPPHALLRV